MTAVQAIDCATKLTSSVINTLKKDGVKTVVRYLVDPNGPSAWKALTAQEAKLLSSAGLEIVSVYETNPTSVKYFKKGQGSTDAMSAMVYAELVGQPHNSTIYFAVDYDDKPADMDTIKAYFAEIGKNLKGYKVGVYGSYDVLQSLKGKVDHYYQTYAWSAGKLSKLANLYQYQNGQTLAGIGVDYDRVISECGSWTVGKVTTAKPTASKPEAKPTATTYKVKSGDNLSEIGQAEGVDWREIAKLNGIKSPYPIYPGQVLKLPAGAKSSSQAEYYTVVSGDTSWGIAQKYHTTVSALQKLNPSIKDMDKIFPGQKMRIK